VVQRKPPHYLRVWGQTLVKLGRYSRNLSDNHLGLYRGRMAALTLTTTDLGIEVRCSKCHALLDRAPDERTAYCRAGKYGDHACKAKQNVRESDVKALSATAQASRR